jgi:RND superfamily putative drug exporter
MSYNRAKGTHETIVERVTGWSIRHRWTVLGGWIGLVLISVAIGGIASGTPARSLDPGQSAQAERILAAQHGTDPVRENVLIQANRPDAFTSDPRLRAATEDLVATLRRMPGTVAGVVSPLEPGQSARVSADGRSGLVGFQLAGPVHQFSAQVATALHTVSTVAGRHPGVRLAEAGDESLTTIVDKDIQQDMSGAEHTSLPVTLVILLLVFGSLVAAGVPLLLAGTTVAATFGLLGMIGQWVPVNSASSVMILLIGMAVGIDYSLFYLRREREERAAGRSPAEALRIAARTSGAAIVVSGVTVLLCVLGLLFTGMDVFRGLTVGAVLVVGLAVLGSVTALPALLSVLGGRVDALRIPWIGRWRTAGRDSRVWSVLVGAVVRRPLLWGVAGVLVLGALALPALGMRLQDPSTAQSLSRSVPVIDAAVRMDQAFPGAATPARVVIWSNGAGPALNSAQVQQAVNTLPRTGPMSTALVDRAMVLRVPLPGTGTDATSSQALDRLRTQVLPRTFGRIPGIGYAVMGVPTAQAADFTRQLDATTGWVFAFVLGLAFVVFVLAFRSWAVPVVSIALNLLSVGAAYGVVTWVFQDGHLGGLLGFTAYGGVLSWLPLFLFVILFGLSMDYHIFILSRIRERRLGGASMRTAVVGGIRSSAGVVTSAAVIMTGVFSVFVSLSAIEYKMIGVGMAVAVILDATLVRGILLPSALALLGDRTWSRSRLTSRRESRRR